MKFCSIWTNLSPHSLNSINKEEKEAVDLNSSYYKIIWNTGKETKDLYNEEIIAKTIKKYWLLIDSSEFILWNTENRSPEKVDDPNNKNFDLIRISEIFRENSKKFEST